jgi:GNAT superfamily N-acetyltransferase
VFYKFKNDKKTFCYLPGFCKYLSLICLHCSLLVSNPGDEILGYVTYFFGYYTWIGKSLYMYDLYVRPVFWGAGVGIKLINEVITFAKTENCKKIRWQVSKWNHPAIDFYKSLEANVDTLESNCDLVF